MILVSVLQLPLQGFVQVCLLKSEKQLTLLSRAGIYFDSFGDLKTYLGLDVCALETAICQLCC